MCRTRSWVQILSSHNVSVTMTAPGFVRVVSRDTSPISEIFGPAFQLSSSRKFATLCYHRNRHRRAQPSGWLYSSTTQRPTQS